ncbi:transcription factor subunit Med10 of mediator complex-domain-containing protein [Phellopilus nigrolimitatus]|nr:transcription factor subunit Med10 of mediator complex-domain-containing protein [Phellopilus nigrolimitatus]
MAQYSTFGATPDSPGDISQTPPPTGAQGDLELEIVGLANALYNLGTTVVIDSTKERQLAKSAVASEEEASKPVGQRVNDVIGHLSTIEDLAGDLRTMVPLQILQDIDNARNPMFLTKDRLERAATENQFMNGKIKAIESYRNTLNSSLMDYFPELAPHLDSVDEYAIPSVLTSNHEVKYEV